MHIHYIVTFLTERHILGFLKNENNKPVKKKIKKKKKNYGQINLNSPEIGSHFLFMKIKDLSITWIFLDF